MHDKELVIPKEKATFWMDGHGRWHNKHGPFENKKVIEYFNAAIQLDSDGYHVAQNRDGTLEKVYFFHEDTALFVMDIIKDKSQVLLLNTRARIPFQADKLFIRNDQLYYQNASERIKFSERALLRIANRVVFEQGRYFFKKDQERYLIPDRSAGADVNDR